MTLETLERVKIKTGVAADIMAVISELLHGSEIKTPATKKRKMAIEIVRVLAEFLFLFLFIFFFWFFSSPLFN